MDKEQITNAETQPSTADTTVDGANAKETKAFDFLELIDGLADQDPVSLELPKNFEDEKSKKLKKKQKKVEKDIAAIMAAPQSESEKMTQLFEIFQKTLTEAKTSNSEYYSSKKSHLNAKADRDAAQTENSKIFNVNNNLNNLYEELQKQNKSLITEHNRLQDEEKSVRKQLVERFQAQVNDITARYEETSLDQMQKAKENEILKERLKEVDDAITNREKTLTDHLSRKEKERDEHFDKTMEQFQVIENEAGRKDEYQVELDKALASEKEVQAKLSQYVDRSDRFQHIMGRANEFFNRIRKEMTSLSTKTKKLDDDNVQLQKQCEKKDVSILELLTECSQHKQKYDTSVHQVEGLEKLKDMLTNQINAKRQELGEVTIKQE